MIPFHIGKKKFRLKTRWDELSVAEVLAILQIAGDDTRAQLFAILSGMTVIEWKNILKKYRVDSVELATSFINDRPDFKMLPMPERIKINNRFFKIPDENYFNSILKAGQKFDFDSLVLPEIEKTGDGITRIAEILAIVFYEHFSVDKTYNSDNLGRVIELCRDVLFVEAYPVASFFLRVWLQSLSENAMNSHMSRMNMNRAPALTNSENMAP